MSSKKPEANSIISVDLVGAGGNGSWIMPMLARAAEKKPLQITIWDDDIIEKKNTINQNLPFLKLREHKAKVISDYYNKATSPKIPFKYEISRYKPRESDIVISAVDNKESRQEIAESKWHWWVDCGVEIGRAYASINTKTQRPSEDIFMRGDKDSGLTCIQFSSPSQNIIAGAMAFILMNAKLEGEEIEKPFLVYNQKDGISNTGFQTHEPEIQHVMPSANVAFNASVNIDESGSWIFKWLLSELSPFKFSLLYLLPKISQRNKRNLYPNIYNLIELVSSFTEHSGCVVKPYISLFNDQCIKFNLHQVVGHTHLNQYVIRSGPNKARIFSTFRNVEPFTCGSLTNRPIEGYDNGEEDDKLTGTLNETIKAALSSYVLYLQTLTRIIDKAEVTWLPGNVCFTSKLTESKLATRTK